MPMRETGQQAQWPLQVIVALCVGFFILDVQLPLGVAGGVPYVVVILLSLWAASSRFTIGVAVAASALTIVGYLLSEPGSAMWIVLTNRALALFVIWSTTFLGLRRAQSEAQLREALANVKTLRGMMPVCASCHKVRNDEGYWQRIEAYVVEHSEVEISHGVCPVCAKQLYPEHYQRMFPGLAEDDFVELDGGGPASPDPKP